MNKLIFLILISVTYEQKLFNCLFSFFNKRKTNVQSTGHELIQLDHDPPSTRNEETTSFISSQDSNSLSESQSSDNVENKDPSLIAKIKRNALSISIISAAIIELLGFGLFLYYHYRLKWNLTDVKYNGNFPVNVTNSSNQPIIQELNSMNNQTEMSDIQVESNVIVIYNPNATGYNASFFDRPFCGSARNPKGYLIRKQLEVDPITNKLKQTNCIERNAINYSKYHRYYPVTPEISGQTITDNKYLLYEMKDKRIRLKKLRKLNRNRCKKLKIKANTTHNSKVFYNISDTNFNFSDIQVESNVIYNPNATGYNASFFDRPFCYSKYGPLGKPHIQKLVYDLYTDYIIQIECIHHLSFDSKKYFKYHSLTQNIFLKHVSYDVDISKYPILIKKMCRQKKSIKILESDSKAHIITNNSLDHVIKSNVIVIYNPNATGYNASFFDRPFCGSARSPKGYVLGKQFEVDPITNTLKQTNCIERNDFNMLLFIKYHSHNQTTITAVNQPVTHASLLTRSSVHDTKDIPINSKYISTSTIYTLIAIIFIGLLVIIIITLLYVYHNKPIYPDSYTIDMLSA